MSSQTLTIASLAAEALEQFETRMRDDGTDYVATKDDLVPAWVGLMIREAHGEFLPDDFKYATTREALDRIADDGEHLSEDGMLDLMDEFAQDVDTYNGERLAWLGSHGSRAGYVDEAREESGEAQCEQSIMDLIGSGQYIERREVFQSVLQSLTREVEERNDA